ncbi:MAG: hypothetical protein ACQEUT_10760 [Bacillota bacterium]
MMILFLVILTAAAYGLIMKYVLNNVFVSNRYSQPAAPKGLAEENSRELIPAYNRQ